MWRDSTNAAASLHSATGEGDSGEAGADAESDSGWRRVLWLPVQDGV